MENRGLQIANDLDAEQEEVEIIGTHTLCRLCGSQNERLIGIYSDEGISNDLSNKINLYLPIKVTASDELPLQCCWNCASTLLAWHELAVTSVEIDRKFRNSQFISYKTVDADDSCGNSVNPLGEENEVCDNEGLDSKSVPTSLNDFSHVPKRSPKIKKKRPAPSVVLPLQDSPPLDAYITDIEQHLIDPELVDNPEYKIDIDQDERSLTDEHDGEETTETKNRDLKDLPSHGFKSDDGEEERPYLGCQFCPAIFFSEKAIVDHVTSEHGKEYVKFLQLPKGVSSAVEENIKKEKRKHNKIDQEAISAAKVVVDGRIYYNCKECGKNLHSPYTYTWHIRIHTGERPYVCDLCGKQFRVSQGLVRHLRETHEGIKKFPCDLCGRMFATRRNVEEHRRIHTNERPYVCDLCGKSFKQKASLFVHKRSHRNYFPFKCSYCNQGFRTKPPLLVHITRHTGEKPYKCDVCGRCFRIKYELKRHRLIHSDEKPWVCNICGFSFRQKRYLRNHTKSNHSAVA